MKNKKVSKIFAKFKQWTSREDVKRTPLGKIFIFLKWLHRRYCTLKLVNWRWLLALRFKSMFSRKIKVGFGPVVTGENTLANRKWHIDPVVNYINKHSKKYACDVFIHSDNLFNFDIIVDMKNFDDINPQLLKRLKKENKVLIYDICDNPLGCKKSYHQEPWFVRSIDSLIINNPLQGEDIQKYNPNFRLIEMPVINYRHKKDYHKKGPVNILFEGYVENLELTSKRINPIIERLIREDKCDINMIYHTNLPSKDQGRIKFIKWELPNWENVLVASDIAVVIKPTKNQLQQRKPSTKVNIYRAAGLPVICTPSEADKLVIEHGRTGFFAYTDEDWYRYLKKLTENHELREKVAKAGRKYVFDNFGIDKITQKYTDLFDELLAKRR